jgi:hypothetical protein
MRCIKTVKAGLLASRNLVADWARRAVRRFRVAVPAALFIGLVILLMPIIRGKWAGYQYFGGDLYPPADELTVAFHFEAFDYPRPGQSDYATVVNGRIFEVQAPEEFSYDGMSIWLDRIRVRSVSDDIGGDNPFIGVIEGFVYSFSYSETFNNDACFGADEGLGQTLPRGDNTYRPHGVDATVPDYYFPYDSFTLQMRVSLIGTVTLDDGSSKPVTIAPRVVGAFDPSRWETSVEVTRDSDSDGPGTVISVEFQRPLLYRILTPLILFLLALAIILLPFVKDVGSTLEVSVGLLFGLWGTREILIPSAVTWPTIIEPLILSLYALLALSVSVTLVILPAWHRLKASEDDTEDKVPWV